MALTRFQPDPDLFDPEDDESWIGTWDHDDGTSLYGLGDPEMGRELLAANDAPPASPYGQQNMSPALPLPESREVLDAGAPLAPQPPQGLAPPPAIARPPEPVEAPPPMLARPPEAPEESPDWADDIPPAVAMALEQHAGDAGLSPASLAAIIKHESGWDPSVVNGKTGKHAGLIQFSQDGWGDVAKAAGRPDVTWEEMRGMSAEEQLPFVVAYYKGKGLGAESTTADYAMRTFMPAYANETDDFVLGEQGSDEMRGDVRSGKVFEQNQGLDLNKDGRITKGEVGQAYAGGGARPGTGPAAGSAPRGSMPGSMGGIPLAEVQQSGIPLTPQELAARQSEVGQRYAAVAGAQVAAQNERIRGREEVQAEWAAAHEQQGKDAAAEEQKQAAIAQEASAQIDREVNQPIQKIDPGRYFREMSSGNKVLGGIAVALSAVGQAFMNAAGMNPGANTALAVISNAIDADIASQKDALAAGREQSSNRVAHWSRILGNAEQGVRAARAEGKQAAAALLQTKAMKAETADIRAKAMQDAAALFAQGQQEIQALTDQRNKSLTARYAIPAPRAAGKTPAEQALEAIQAAKGVRQELALSGKSPEEVNATMRAMGLPVIEGDTMAQNQHKVDKKHQDETLDNKERQAEAAYETLGAYAKTTPLKRDPQTGKWTAPAEVGLGWKLEDRKARNATRGAAIESFGRLQSDGVISPSEEERFGEMLGGWDTTLEELAENLNAIERIVQARRNQTRTGDGAIPGNWK